MVSPVRAKRQPATKTSAGGVKSVSSAINSDNVCLKEMP